jgi:hypothetical protein
MTNIYDVGDLVHLSATFTQDDTAVDPTTVALTVRHPDGTQTAYEYPATITREGLGTFYVDVPITMGGTHRYRWVSTGTGQAAQEGSLSVRVRRVQ